MEPGEAEAVIAQAAAEALTKMGLNWRPAVPHNCSTPPDETPSPTTGRTVSAPGVSPGDT